MRTVSFYSIDGVSKAKTAKAILVSAHGKEAWLPLRFASVKFTGPNYQVRVSVPDWLYNKINWKTPEVVEKAPEAPAAPKKPTNPYVGMDYGNMMEELMILNEILAHEEREYGMYQDSDDFPKLEQWAKEIAELKKRIVLINEAAQAAMA